MYKQTPILSGRVGSSLLVSSKQAQGPLTVDSRGGALQPHTGLVVPKPDLQHRASQSNSWRVLDLSKKYLVLFVVVIRDAGITKPTWPFAR